MAAKKDIVLVTGANGGLGIAIAQDIATTPPPPGFMVHHALYTLRSTVAAGYGPFSTSSHQNAPIRRTSSQSVKNYQTCGKSLPPSIEESLWEISLASEPWSSTRGIGRLDDKWGI
jgi:hypothetical protein